MSYKLRKWYGVGVVNKGNSAQADEVIKLLAHIQNGSSGAFVKLSEKYKPLLDGEVARYVNSLGDADIEDLRQGALVSLYHAALSYRGDQGVTFGLYAKICIVNGIADTLRYLGKKMADVSMDFITESELPESDLNPQSLMLDKEDFEIAMDKIRQTLSALEYRIFELYLGGYSYAEISRAIGKSEKSVDNALRRAKDKVKKIF